MALDQNKKYHPINCSFYDLLEADATLKNISTIVFLNGNNRQAVCGIIQDLFIKDKAEYLALDRGPEIRLDHIVSFNGAPRPGKNFC